MELKFQSPAVPWRLGIRSMPPFRAGRAIKFTFKTNDLLRIACRFEPTPLRGETPYKSVNGEMPRDLDYANPFKQTLQSRDFDHKHQALLWFIHFSLLEAEK